jgi:hypothetical protein
VEVVQALRQHPHRLAVGEVRQAHRTSRLAPLLILLVSAYHRLRHQLRPRRQA